MFFPRLYIALCKQNTYNKPSQIWFSDKTNPLLQEQLYDPCRLLHDPEPASPQIRESSEHSSMSKNIWSQD